MVVIKRALCTFKLVLLEKFLTCTYVDLYSVSQAFWFHGPHKKSHKFCGYPPKNYFKSYTPVTQFMAIFTHRILTNIKKKLKLQKLSLSKFITKIMIFLAMKINLTLGKTSSRGVGWGEIHVLLNSWTHMKPCRLG